MGFGSVPALQSQETKRLHIPKKRMAETPDFDDYEKSGKQVGSFFLLARRSSVRRL